MQNSCKTVIKIYKLEKSFHKEHAVFFVALLLGHNICHQCSVSSKIQGLHSSNNKEFLNVLRQSHIVLHIN